VAGDDWATAFLFGAGRGAGACGGLFSINAYSFARTGDAGCSAACVGSWIGDPSDEEGISSMIGDPGLALLLLVS